MRVSRSLVFFGVVGVLAAQACVGDDSATPNNPSLDAGGLDAQTAPDTSTVLPGPDSSPDTAPPDAGLEGPVTVLVADEAKTPVLGVKVAFYDALGASTIEVTGADGKAVHTMGAGGSVLVAEMRAGGEKRLTSILAVEPYDTLVVAGGEPLAIAPTFATISVGMVAPFATATTYEVTAGCTSVTPPITGTQPMTVTEACVAGGKVALLAIARNVTGNPIAYATKEVTGITQNANVAAPAVAAGDWVAATDGTFTVTGTKPAHAVDGYVETSFLKNQQAFLAHTNAATAVAFTNLPFPRPPTGFADLFANATTIGFDDGPDGGVTSSVRPVSILVKQAAPPAAAAVTARYADFLPRVHSVAVTGTASPNIVWASDDAVTGVGGFAKFRGSIELDGGGFDQVDWLAVFPANAMSTTLPALPASLAPFQPTQSVVLDSFGIVDSPELGSYKKFRSSFSAYTDVVYDVTYKLPPAALTARVTGVRFVD